MNSQLCMQSTHKIIYLSSLTIPITLHIFSLYIYTRRMVSEHYKSTLPACVVLFFILANGATSLTTPKKQTSSWAIKTGERSVNQKPMFEELSKLACSLSLSLSLSTRWNEVKLVKCTVSMFLQRKEEGGGRLESKKSGISRSFGVAIYGSAVANYSTIPSFSLPLSCFPRQTGGTNTQTNTIMALLPINPHKTHRFFPTWLSAYFFLQNCQPWMHTLPNK